MERIWKEEVFLLEAFFTIEQHLFAEGGPDKCVAGN